MGILIFAVIVAVIVIVAAIIYGALVWGLVTYKFWYWFILPVFPTLPEISFIEAIGIMFFISLFKTAIQQSIKKEHTNEKITTISALVAPWVSLLLGYLFYSWFYII